VDITNIAPTDIQKYDYFISTPNNIREIKKNDPAKLTIASFAGLILANLRQQYILLQLHNAVIGAFG